MQDDEVSARPPLDPNDSALKDKMAEPANPAPAAATLHVVA